MDSLAGCKIQMGNDRVRPNDVTNCYKSGVNCTKSRTGGGMNGAGGVGLNHVSSV